MSEALAAIDIGTNSIHLVVVKLKDSDRFEILAQEKEVVRLGSGSKDMKVLTADAMNRGIEALKRFRQSQPFERVVDRRRMRAVTPLVGVQNQRESPVDGLNYLGKLLPRDPIDQLTRYPEDLQRIRSGVLVFELLGVDHFITPFSWSAP